jgi:hypothetical protein
MAATKKKDTTPHVPNDKTRAEVGALVSFGNTQEQIAEHLGISVDTLTRHYRDELDNSVVRANAKVAAKLFRKATDGDDLSAMIFWLKTRAKWREKDEEGSASKKLVEMLIDKLVE